jgi:hypothetical protein
LSTGQLIVTIASVGLLGAFHLVLRTVRAPAGAASVTAPRPAARRDPLMALLALAALAALAFAGVAFVVSVLDDGDDDDTTAPATPTTTTARAATDAPPPPQPPPPPAPAALEPPSGAVFVARVVAQPDGAVASRRNRVGEAPRVREREAGIYEVTIPGLTPKLRRAALVRARPANSAPGVLVSVRKVGPSADFVVFTRDEQTGAFAETGFEFAVFLPKQELEGAAGEEEGGRERLPPTR